MNTKQVKRKLNQVILKKSDILSRCDSLMASADGQLEATTDDPHIYLDLQLARGYYLVRSSIEFGSQKLSTRIYYASVNDGSYSEEQSLCLQAHTTEVANAWSVLYLDEESFIRFDPVDKKCTFRLNHFSIIPCSKRFARRLIQSHLPKLEQGKLDRDEEAHDILLFDDYKTIQESQYGPRGLQKPIRYEEWLMREKYLLDRDQHKIAAHIRKLKHKPLISIILPVYNTPHCLLTECIDSVLNQDYDNWQLCISDDNSSDPNVRNILDRYVKKDRRIKCVYRSTNGHISANSNSALELATGEYYAFLDHDDLLAPHALLYMVTAINEEPSAGILYSDEDKVDEEGKRLNPHFKPAFNFEMLLCQNYICHFLCIRGDIVKSVNGFDAGAEGCQDHILLIKAAITCSERKLNIVHVPVILYHWRMTEGSTALDANNKSYTNNNYLESLGKVFRDFKISDVKVAPNIASNTYHAIYNIGEPAPLASIIIPTRNALSLTRQCYESILRHESAYPNFEIIIVDNQSDDPEALSWFSEIQKHSKTRVINYDSEFNYSAINNHAAENTRGKILILLNNDIEVISENWLALLVSHAARESVGCVGAMLYFDDNTIQHAGAILGIGGVAGHSHKYIDRNSFGYHSRLCLTQEVSAVTAACLAVRKDVYHAVKGLDEANLKVAFNDIDFCLRVQEAGFRNIFEPRAKLYHYESKSRGKEDSPEKQARFQSEVSYMKSKWKTYLDEDPFYNPNLTLDREDFTLRLPEFSLEELSLRKTLALCGKPSA